MWYVKDHGDFGATSLSYFFAKKYSVEFIQCFNFFLVFWLCVCVLFVYNNQCVDKVYLTTPMNLSGIPWLFIYLLLLRGSLIYCTTYSHFCGCVCNISKPMVTWVHLVYLVIFNLLFGEVCMCVIFMIWCLFGSVVSSKLWTWLISTKWPRPHLQEHELLRTSKKWFIWIIYKNKWTCIFCKKPSEIFYSAPLRNCSLPLWNTSRCMFDLTIIIEWKNIYIFFHGGWTSLFNCYYFNIINIRI